MKDVLVSLTDNHVVLAWLAQRLRSSRDPTSCTVLFNELSKALGGHLSALESVVLPALSRCKWRGLDSQLLVDHMKLKRHLADLLTLDHAGERFQAELAEFCTRIEAQADREQLSLLPALRECIDEGERAMLASDVESRIGAYLDGVDQSAAEHDLERAGAESLLAEAQIVLTSLPGGPLR